MRVCVIEFSCLLVFLVGRRLDRRRRHIHRPCPKWLFIVPSACDWTASTMVFFSTLIMLVQTHTTAQRSTPQHSKHIGCMIMTMSAHSVFVCVCVCLCV